jgi:(S)-2-hydroxyglutarate dehydrogenase
LHDFIIIGGGVVGLATARALGRRQPAARVLVIEKETEIAQHQTGRNSGVIHSGLYYPPGSLKARFARAGGRSMVEFCQEHQIPHEICGKVIVATRESELPLLENLFRRGLQNGLPVGRMEAAQVREIEPHVRCLAGVRVPSTGIVSYRQVSAKLVELIQQEGGTVELGAPVEAIAPTAQGHRVQTRRGPFEARFLVNCTGLHSDRMAQLAGVTPGAKIVPFRGEYYELVPKKRALVNGLVYPVPNPEFPFLGVHFTRMIDGNVHAGPNAVLAFKREGYRKTDFSPRDFAETMTYGGFWRLARRHFAEGMKEMYRPVSKAAFLRSLQQIIPEITCDDVVPTQAGVRAQALRADGQLVDDFLIVPGLNSLHVCNAPSPAATAALEIGEAIADRLPNLPTRITVGV